MNLNRRTFLKAGALSAASLFLPFSRRNAEAHVGMPPGVLSRPVVPFTDPLKLPVLLKPKVKGNTDYYTITMKETVAQFHSEMQQTTIWGYDGHFPGPMIKARKGRRVVVKHINNLPASSGMGGMGGMAGMSGMMGDPAVHLHGALVAPDSDGHPMDSIAPGQSREYTYTNKQRAALLWFHDHAHGRTGANVYKGLAGLYLLTDPLEAALKLPSGPYEVPLVIQDRVFQNNWAFRYDTDEATLQTGMLGDIYLVNGVAFPQHKVDARKYRFRILNGSNSRLYGLALSTSPSGAPIDNALIQIGTDGGLLQRPMPKSKIDIWPSERLDIVIDFSQFPVGTQLYLRNTYEVDEMASIVRFDVTRKVKDTSKVPEFLSAWEELPESEVVQTRTVTLGRTNIDGTFTWTINGKAYDPANEPFAKPKLNTIERWKFVNPTNHPHPVHLHLVQFQVVNIDGQPVEPSDYGWKDTMLVRENGGETTILVKFTGYTGRYVFHCHNLEHEDYSMMGEFEVVA
ncbi:multicopper oxidase family protein [Verrucomicrobiota bacterium sgz303538]